MVFVTNESEESYAISVALENEISKIRNELTKEIAASQRMVFPSESFDVSKLSKEVTGSKEEALDVAKDNFEKLRKYVKQAQGEVLAERLEFFIGEVKRKKDIILDVPFRIKKAIEKVISEYDIPEEKKTNILCTSSVICSSIDEITESAAEKLISLTSCEKYDKNFSVNVLPISKFELIKCITTSVDSCFTKYKIDYETLLKRIVRKAVKTELAFEEEIYEEAEEVVQNFLIEMIYRIQSEIMLLQFYLI